MAFTFSAPPSQAIKKFEWLGERLPHPAPEIKGDSYPMTWADDDELYTSAGDPCWGPSPTGLDVEKFSGNPPDYQISLVNPMPGYTGSGPSGPKPSGMICVGGLLYLSFENLLRTKPPMYGTNCQHASDAHIVVSSDHGRTWTPNIEDIKTPMFPGPLFGGPAFVNFGKNNAGARDHFVYAVSADQWDNGSQLRVGRVYNTQILRADCWQWVCGWTRGGEPIWLAQLDKAIPVLTEERHFSHPEIVYLPGIKRYLLLSWWLHQDFNPHTGSGLVIFEAPEPWGPFSLVHVEPQWETVRETPYCPRIPLKWMEPDGVTGWLQSSGNWNWPPSGNPEDAKLYRSHVRKFRLTLA